MSTAKKTTITRDDIPVSDERTITRLLKSLGVEIKESEEPADLSGGPVLPWYDGPASPLLTYLRGNILVQAWTKDKDVWLALNEDKGVVRHVTIAGLKDEKEARLLRSEFQRGRYERGLRLTTADLETVAADIVAMRDRRKYQENFLHALKDIRNHFKWQDGATVESGGRFIPISSFGFLPDDVALLRAVYERLPPTLFDRGGSSIEGRVKIKDETCPTCGRSERVKGQAVKTRSDALRKLNEFHGHHGQQVFQRWVKARVATDALSFTSSKDLHDDYLRWAAKHGENSQRKRDSKDTRLTLHVWGRLMRGQSFIPVKRGYGKGYRVRLTARSSL